MNITYFQKLCFCTFLAILIFEVPMWSTCFSHLKGHFNYPEKVTTPAKSKSKEGSYFWNFFCLAVICKTSLNCDCNCDDNIFFYFTTIAVKSRLLLI